MADLRSTLNASLGLRDSYGVVEGHNLFHSEDLDSDTLDHITETICQEIVQRLHTHYDSSSMIPSPKKDSIRDKLVLPAADQRTMETIIHALYTGRLERTDGWGHFRSNNIDYEALYDLADQLELRSLQTLIYHQTGDLRFRRHDSSINDYTDTPSRRQARMLSGLGAKK